MNERNIEALAKMLGEYMGEHCGMECDGSAREAAAFLAARGVLVPSALTDDEATVTPPFDGEFVATTSSVPEQADTHRAALERIARGE